jgi:hypothetical protein
MAIPGGGVLMYGYPFSSETDWLETNPAPKPKTVAKSMIEARGPDAHSAMDAMRRRIEAETKKSHVWREDADCWTLVEGEAPKDRIVTKHFPKP